MASTKVRIGFFCLSNMCGINGIFAYHPSAKVINRAELIRVRDHMSSRGPDGKGEWIDQRARAGFGHRRLSIIELSEAGAQPMISVDGRFTITFNVEIYNYQELKRKLEAKGYAFQSNSDTEVLLNLYSDKGDAMVHDLRGMFAFAIWDNKNRVMFLARDPYGIKPLYYTDDNKCFRFASQVKALLMGVGVSRDPDPAGHVGFYLWGSVPEPFTMYRDINTLPAGTSMIVDVHGAKEPRAYFSIAGIYHDAEAIHKTRPSPQKAEQTVRSALLDSVRHHLVADVPVGAFLSAGIDSGALVGLMRDASAKNIQTVTLGFEEFRGRHVDESPLASRIAQRYETNHTTRVVTAAEFREDLPRILDAMDQPSIDGINTWFVSKAAHELGLKVAVSGLGGDELFGGYPSFRDLPRWFSYFRIPSKMPWIGRGLRKLGQAACVDRLGINPKALGLIEYGGNYAGAYLLRRGIFMPWELGSVLDTDTIREGWCRLAPLQRINTEISPKPLSAFGRVAALESSLYMRNQLLRDTDWAGMAHSLEIRVPLVDSVLLDNVASAMASHSTSGAKRLLAQAPQKPLPNEIVNRKKTGFGIPVGGWSEQGTSTSTRPATGYARAWACKIARQFVETSAKPAEAT